MASSTHRIGPNFRAVILKAASLRLSDVDARDTTDYAELICGAGVPSGGYGRDAGASLIYVRTDASGVDVVLYVSPDGGTTWNAVGSSGMAADAELTAIAALTSAANKVIRFTGSGTAELIDCTAAGAALLDDANAAAQLTTLGAIAAATLAATTNGAGASLVGVEDVGSFYVAATVEAALAELGPLLIGTADRFVKATLAVADTAGGGTAAALTLQLNKLDGNTPIGAARQVLILATVAQYGAELGNSSVTFGSATTGSIIASGNGWALVETNSAGAFACTASNSDDETAYFAAAPPPHGVSDLTKGVLGVISNSDAATWSA